MASRLTPVRARPYRITAEEICSHAEAQPLQRRPADQAIRCQELPSTSSPTAVGCLSERKKEELCQRRGRSNGRDAIGGQANLQPHKQVNSSARKCITSGAESMAHGPRSKR